MGSVLEELSGAVAKVASLVGPSVVGVGAGGSGVVAGEGLVVTNAHNLRDEQVVVTFADGRREHASVRGADREGDLALLSVETAGAPALEWSPAQPGLGEAVVAAANPGGRGPRVALGFVTSVDAVFRGPGGRRIAGALEHSAPLARGSSGGPLVDAQGRLVGINTHREGDGLYLALPAGSALRQRIDALARGESPSRVRLGVALAPPRVARRLRRSVGLPERDGLLVHAVEEHGPAHRAGIRAGDLIVGVSGAPVGSADDLADALDDAAAGGSIELSLVRGVEEITVSVDLRSDGASDEGQV